MAIGIPVAIVVIAAAAAYTDRSGNLSDYQLLVRATSADGPFLPKPADIPALQAGVDRLVAPLKGATVVPIAVTRDPLLEPHPELGPEAVSLGKRAGNGFNDVSLLYVATPELLAIYGVDPGSATNDLLTTETGDLILTGVHYPPGTDRGTTDTTRTERSWRARTRHFPAPSSRPPKSRNDNGS